MYTFLMSLFIILCFILVLFVLSQQGKNDLGASSLSGSQTLFGGSGGQTFLEKATWTMGALFIFGALGLSILRSKEERKSILEGVIMPSMQATQKNTNNVNHTTSTNKVDDNLTEESTEENTNTNNEPINNDTIENNTEAN